MLYGCWQCCRWRGQLEAVCVEEEEERFWLPLVQEEPKRLVD